MYKVEILDPFLKRKFLGEDYTDIESHRSLVFEFDDQLSFIEETMSYVVDFSLNYTFDLLVKEHICPEEDRDLIFSHLPRLKVETLFDQMCDKIKYKLDRQIRNVQFDFISFFLTESLPERKKMKNFFYEASKSLYSPENQIAISLPAPSEELVYFILQKNGGVQLLDKSSSEIDYFPYSQQEEAVAKTCHLNPETVLVYDPEHLLAPEMVVCFKKILGRSVSFIDCEFPTN